MIKIIKENNKNSADEAVKYLKSGKIIAIATDTIYGVGVDAKNFEAIENLYKLKKRSKNKAIAILLPNLDKAKEIFVFDELANKIAEKFLPGALTLVLEVKKQQDFLNKNLNINDNFLGFRIIKNDFCDKIFANFNGAIALTSANLSGEGSTNNIEDIVKSFAKTKFDLLVVDAGNLETKIASTVVKINQNKLEILREGKITINEIEKFK